MMIQSSDGSIVYFMCARRCGPELNAACMYSSIVCKDQCESKRKLREQKVYEAQRKVT